MDRFSVSTARVDIVGLMGYGHSIPDAYWQAELRLPETYEASQLALRDLWEKNRTVSWPTIDMTLNQDPAIAPLGWRVFSHLYQNEEYMPLSWIEVLTGGDMILFPYAVCYLRRSGQSDLIMCAAFRYSEEESCIEARAVNRWMTGAACPIAVYELEGKDIIQTPHY